MDQAINPAYEPPSELAPLPDHVRADRLAPRGARLWAALIDSVSIGFLLVPLQMYAGVYN